MSTRVILSSAIQRVFVCGLIIKKIKIKIKKDIAQGNSTKKKKKKVNMSFCCIFLRGSAEIEFYFRLNLISKQLKIGESE